MTVRNDFLYRNKPIHMKLWKLKTHLVYGYMFDVVSNHQLYFPVYLKNKNTNI